MNSEFIKKALLFAVGVGVGVVVGALVMKKRYDPLLTKTYEYKDIEQEAVEENCSAIEETIFVKERRGRRREYSKLIEDHGYGVDGVVSGQDIDDYKNEQASIAANDNTKNKEPYVITIEQFSEENDHYDKSTIYYYEDDEVLAEENEEVITDVFGVIGDDALGSFGEGSNDAEIVYVRNDKLQMDFEVIRLSKSYSKTVLGYKEE